MNDRPSWEADPNAWKYPQPRTKPYIRSMYLWEQARSRVVITVPAANPAQAAEIVAKSEYFRPLGGI